MRNFSLDLEDMIRRESALTTILDDMEIPLMRRDVTQVSNLRWLMRNLRVKNGDRPLCATALEITKILLSWNEKQTGV